MIEERNEMCKSAKMSTNLTECGLGELFQEHMPALEMPAELAVHLEERVLVEVMLAIEMLDNRIELPAQVEMRSLADFQAS